MPGCVLDGVTSRMPGATGGLAELFWAVFWVAGAVCDAVDVSVDELFKP
jgi:hypothetical protein